MVEGCVVGGDTVKSSCKLSYLFVLSVPSPYLVQGPVHTIGGFKERTCLVPQPLGQNVFMFAQFLGKIGQIGWRPPLRVGVLLHAILDPSLHTLPEHSLIPNDSPMLMPILARYSSMSGEMGTAAENR